MEHARLPQGGRAHGAARYVAIIADGNRRWARARGLPAAAGHLAAADTLRARISDALELGVRELTVFVFSTENWRRPPVEVHRLMEMFCRRIALETPGLDRDGIRVRFIGRREGVSERLLERMDRVQSLTRENTRMMLFLAFNYGGRAEILDAARRFRDGGEEDFASHLYAPEMHDPEVMIRTGGEQRISNFLLWQSAYSELVFATELWPDFTRGALEGSLREFSERRRRFGGR
jgi:undecaprenyl diphosphate synthase